MPEGGNLGKLLIGIGSIIAVLGVLLLKADRTPGNSNLLVLFGKLPGEISNKRDKINLFFPLGTSIVLSVILSLVFYLLSWIFRR